MKNWRSWIVGGTVVAAAISYSSTRDPLVDLLDFSRSVKQFANASIPETLYKDPWLAFSDVDDSNSLGLNRPDTFSNNVTVAETTGSKLVQQGGRRFESESKEVSNRAHQRNQYSTLRAFRESIGNQWKPTVKILDENRQLALGTIVSDDGWIVSKGSELPESKIEVHLFDGSTAEGSVRIRRNDVDLALIKIERSNLPIMDWNTIADVPVGGWLASAGARSQLPFAIGVMSVVSRNVPRERAVLGVTLGTPPSNEKGALVEAVVEGSGAFRAGVRTGDVIDRIDGDQLTTRDEVLKRLGTLSAGQRVSVGVQRDGESESIVAQMMDLNHSLLDPTEMEVNGEISARSTGFQKVIQHDSVLAPNECGGPIIDVYGNAVGINIARAGRVSTYAIPAKIVAPAIAEMLASVRGQANVVAATSFNPASQTTSNLPASIPTGIEIESLKPEVVVPGPTRR